MVRPGDLGIACSSWDNSECSGTPLCPPRCPRFFDRAGEPVLVLSFKEGDRSDLLAIYERAEPSAATGTLPPRTRRQTERWIDGLIENGWNLLAWKDGRVIGHVGVATPETSEPEFVIFVENVHQDRGIGTELLKQMIAYADARGHDVLTLFVSRENDQAISIYEHLSFEVTEERLASIAMRLHLDAPIVADVQQPPGAR